MPCCFSDSVVLGQCCCNSLGFLLAFPWVCKMASAASRFRSQTVFKGRKLSIGLEGFLWLPLIREEKIFPGRSKQTSYILPNLYHIPILRPGTTSTFPKTNRTPSDACPKWVTLAPCKRQGRSGLALLGTVPSTVNGIQVDWVPLDQSRAIKASISRRLLGLPVKRKQSVPGRHPL